MKHRKLISVLLTVLFLSFIAIIDYPFVSRLYNEHVQGNVVVDYEAAVAEQSDPILEEEWKKAEQYNAALYAEGVTVDDAFQTALRESEEYEALLNLNGDGVMGVIEIPKIHLALPIYHGTSERVLQMGAGHLNATSLPVGGENTHSCISAHRGLPEKTMFTNLDQLEKGDCFYIKVLGKVLAYEVGDIEVVEPQETEHLSIRPGEDMVTLVTCTPYGINTHRLYVHGSRIPWQEEAEETIQAPTQRADGGLLLRQYGWIGITVLLLLWLIFLLYMFNRKGKREESETKSDE